ncbi:MAG TPA: hypothetical protein VJ023_20620 [Pyrinomonadaceae bacterium]|nr:hypothetical protein [Pyrinomonadaceae bacterium]
MNRNQKIALGCGGAGCLGLIVVGIVGVVIWAYTGGALLGNTNFNSSSNTNSNANRSRGNSNTDDLTSSDSNTSESTTSTSMSDDDTHKLFQAAGMTKDSSLIQRVLKKIGMMNADGSTTGDYEQFVKDHFAWAMRNTQFVMEVNDEARARAYVSEHLDD